jgi:hypothetical protein
MGGAVKQVGQMTGLVKKTVGQAAQNVADVAAEKKPEPTKPSRMDEEQGARMRGARRRGRQLLSDARLNAEAGTQTLGGGQSLGQ